MLISRAHSVPTRPNNQPTNHKQSALDSNGFIVMLEGYSDATERQNRNDWMQLIKKALHGKNQRISPTLEATKESEHGHDDDETADEDEQALMG